MGGIVAVIGEAGDLGLGERLERMLARSPHRGEASRHLEGGLAVGVQSLGWDASLHSAGNWLVAFHGYIGNWDELAPAHHPNFPEDATNAHRIAIAYEVLGDDLFRRLRGEFALLILDRRRHELLAVRDVVGCRPLFRARAAGRLYLATEVRQVLAGSGITPGPELDAVVAYLVQHPLQDGRTATAGILRIHPGCVHRFPADAPTESPRTAVYWQPPAEQKMKSLDVPQLRAELLLLLRRAVSRVLPDRPFASTLSGGMDSGTIWALILNLAHSGDPRAARARSISMIYPGLACDESAFIEHHRSLSGSQPMLIDASAQRSVDHLEEMARAVDSIHEATVFQAGILAAAARDDGRRVVVGGIGGDEWFYGNPHYLFDLWRRGHLWTCLRDAVRLTSSRRLGPRTAVRRLLPPGFSLRRMTSRQRPPSWLHRDRHELFQTLQRQRLPETAPKATTSRRALLESLSYRRNDDGITAIAQLYERRGVEHRLPLMDLDLIEFVFRTDARAFIAGERSKHLLRSTMTGLVPGPIVDGHVPSAVTPIVATGLAERAARARDESWQLVCRHILDEKRHRSALAALAGGKIRNATHVYALLAAEWFVRELTTGSDAGG